MAAVVSGKRRLSDQLIPIEDNKVSPLTNGDANTNDLVATNMSDPVSSHNGSSPHQVVNVESGGQNGYVKSDPDANQKVRIF